MKLAFKIICVVGLLVVIGVAVIFILLGGPQSLKLRRHFDSLVKTNDHEAVARAAIEVITAATNQASVNVDRITDLPAVITAMNPRHVSVSDGGMTIEFHGGFDHFGFRIRDRDDHWDMIWYTEDGYQLLTKIKKHSIASKPDTAGNVTPAGNGVDTDYSPRK